MFAGAFFKLLANLVLFGVNRR